MAWSMDKIGMWRSRDMVECRVFIATWFNCVFSCFCAVLCVVCVTVRKQLVKVEVNVYII